MSRMLRSQSALFAESGRVGSFERQEPRELSADALGIPVDLRRAP